MVLYNYSISSYNMTNDQLSSKSLYIQLAELIENKIISGEYRIGDRLPTEFEMAAQYGVSRTVVREAMKALKEKGWVETQVGRGTFIVDNAARGIGTSFDVIVRKNPDHGFERLIEVREILEPEIAALAAQRASDEQIEAMRLAVEQMERGLAPGGDMNDFLQGDVLFHKLLAESCGNPLILSIIGPVVKLMRDQQEYHLYRVQGGGSRSQTNHRLILQSIQKRDPEGARKYMRDHIRQVRLDVQKGFG